MKISLKDILQVLIFTSIGAFILWLLWQSQEAAYLEECHIQGISDENCSLTKKLISDFKSCNFLWVIIVCIIYMLGNICRALRWNQMLAPLGIKPRFYNSFFAIMVAYFTNLGIPRSGEFARAGILAKYENQPFDKVFGTIIMDRILDIISLMILLLLGFVLSFDILWDYLKDQMNVSELGEKFKPYLFALIGLGIIGLGLLYYLFRKDSNFQNPFIIKIRKITLGLWNGLKSVKDVKNIPLFLAYSVGIWLAYFLMNYWMFFAFSPTEHLSAVDALLVFDFGSLGIVFPSPGGMGTYHAMIMESLSIVGIPKVDGFSFAMILFFTINILCNIAFGLIGLLVLPLLNRKG